MGIDYNNPREVEVGDFIHVDEYVRLLKEEGFDAEYENLTEDTSGYVAEVKVRDEETGELEEHAVFDKSAGMDCMMRSMEKRLEDFE